MARRLTEQQLFQELLDRYGRDIADAFMAAVRDLRSGADLQRLQAAIEAGNAEAALAALHLDAAAYSGLLDAMRGAFVDGGQSTTQNLPALTDQSGNVAVIRFNVRNPRAEAWLAEHSAGLVTRILDDQRDAIRARLTEGMAAGQNPRTTALSIVGRIDRASGEREGGIIGLTSVQEQALAKARAELASDDAADLANYLTRARRDKRFDRAVKKAIDSGERIPADIRAKAAQQYSNRLMALRGEMIGRTESLTALNAGRYEATRQMVERTGMSAADVLMTWKSAHDSRVRETHQVLDGETAGLEQAFVSPSGARLRFPGDGSLGAPASELIGCRCIVSPTLK